MPLYQFDPSAVPVWAPLETLARVCARRSALPPLCVSKFMYMGRLRANGRDDVHLYKHVDTRRYLNIDRLGHAYRYAGGDVRCRYEALDGVATALRHVLSAGDGTADATTVAPTASSTTVADPVDGHLRSPDR